MMIVSFYCFIFTGIFGFCKSDDPGTIKFPSTGSIYGRWNKTIPFYIDDTYDVDEANLIRTAISAVVTQLKECVTFEETQRVAPVFKVHFTPLTGGTDSPPHALCFTYPGVNLDLLASTTEQIVSIARGPQGCLDGSLRRIMRQILLLLGRRNEHQRHDRDDFIIIHQENIAFPAAYSQYNSGHEFWGLFPYDYCSITHNQVKDYAKPGMVAFSIPDNRLPGIIPQSDRLSMSDCKFVSLLYSCDPSKCTETVPCTLQTTADSTQPSRSSTGTLSPAMQTVVSYLGLASGAAEGFTLPVPEGANVTKLGISADSATTVPGGRISFQTESMLATATSMGRNATVTLIPGANTNVTGGSPSVNVSLTVVKVKI